MKKIFVLLNLLMLITVFVGCSGNNDIDEKELSLDVNKDVVRFHVLANSDSEEDQALKLKVRDGVIQWLKPRLSKCNNIEEAKKILVDSEEDIEKVSKEIIKNNGYDYGVDAVFTHENFPEKMYGDFVFPQGDYDAYKVLIGDAEGKNWWCVMFPPLCFVDSTKNTVSNEACAKTLEKNVINKKEKKYKFKIVEFIKELF